MIVGVITGIVNILAPRERAGGKYVNFACALVIILVISTPLLQLDSVSLPDDVQAMLNLSDNDQHSDMHSQLILGYSRQYLAQNTAGLVAQNFRISRNDITLHFTIVQQDGQFVIEHIRVDLHTFGAILRTTEIETFVGQLFGIDVEIVEDLR